MSYSKENRNIFQDMNNIKLIPLEDGDRDQFPDGMFRFEKVMKGTDRS